MGKGKWDTVFKSGSSSAFSSVGSSDVYVPRCYESHPPLKIGKGKLYGGSASHPIKKADIYVALQAGSTAGMSSDPWDDQTTVEIHYSIRDGGIPTNVPRFLKMIDWLCDQLQEGKKVHVGCIGGHGRTGLVISAIVAMMLEEKDAIQYVRKNYCEKAVESFEQVDFLMTHFGVSKVEGTKDYYLTTASKDIRLNGHKKAKKMAAQSEALVPVHRPKSSHKPEEEDVVVKVIPPGVTANTRTLIPAPSPRCLWNKKNIH